MVRRLTGEAVEQVNSVLGGEPCKGDPETCPCIFHFNQRRRYAEEQTDQPQMSYDEYVTDIIMGGGSSGEDD